jgi:ArsR family transcriptional regulator, lead/cadmium/zinc/bismuth-responsive transcriptional repressor
MPRRASSAQKVSVSRDMPSVTGNADRCSVRCVHPDTVAQARAALAEPETYASLAETFRALADPTRAKIASVLLHQEICTCDLAAVTGHSESVVSQHLRVLKALRLVKSRRAGKLVFHSLDDLHIRLLLSVCLAHVRDADRGHDGLEQVLAFFEAGAQSA